jgi:aspartyl protease family protein
MPTRAAIVGAGCAALLLWAGATAAQTVSLSGSLGGKALLMIDGAPRTLAVGQTVQGVKLVGVTGSDAVVDVGGRRVNLQLGQAQVNLGGAASAGSGSQIVLTAGSGGHFVTQGSINGKAVSFLVDTGATNVALSQTVAEQIGLNYKAGQRTLGQTANGPIVAYRVVLDTVRIGDVQVYNVEAAVLPAGMEQVLLGNSFLTRFQMKRENDRMTLDKRP